MRRRALKHPTTSPLLQRPATIPASADGYRKTLDGELAAIRRTYELKDRLFAGLWAFFAAALIGIFGFISRTAYGLYGDQITAVLTG